MTAQGIAVAIIVPLCALYAVWQLIGATARRHLLAWLARGPWPAALRRRLAQMDAASGACGCDGCDNAAHKAEPPGQAVVRVHRRRHHG